MPHTITHIPHTHTHTLSHIQTPHCDWITFLQDTMFLQIFIWSQHEVNNQSIVENMLRICLKNCTDDWGQRDLNHLYNTAINNNNKSITHYSLICVHSEIIRVKWLWGGRGIGTWGKSNHLYTPSPAWLLIERFTSHLVCWLINSTQMLVSSMMCKVNAVIHAWMTSSSNREAHHIGVLPGQTICSFVLLCKKLKKWFLNYLSIV